MRFMFTYCLEMSTTTVMEWRESGTLSRLYMLEFNHLVDITVLFKGNAVAKFTCRNHI